MWDLKNGWSKAPRFDIKKGRPKAKEGNVMETNIQLFNILPYHEAI